MNLQTILLSDNVEKNINENENTILNSIKLK